MSARREKIIVALHVLWFSLVFGIGLWWMSLLIKQAHRVAELETTLGLPAVEIEGHLASMKRLVFWEGGAFLLLATLATVLLVWLYISNRAHAKSLEGFFTAVTHELKTPLTSVRLQAESLQEEIPSSKLITRLLDDTLRLEAQVERALELARVEGGGRYHVSPVNLRVFIDRLFNPWLEVNGDRLEVQNSVEDQDVLADKTALSVVLRNILENVVRHGNKNKINLRVHTEALDKDRVRLVFQDSGVGYLGNTKKLGQLFKKGPESPGAGVGLYLVKNLTKRMGGTASLAHNTEGFRVELTLRAAP